MRFLVRPALALVFAVSGATAAQARITPPPPTAHSSSCVQARAVFRREHTYIRCTVHRRHHHRRVVAPPTHTSWSWPWSCIAQHESGGNPAENTGNGFYGGLQFTMSTWLAYGGQGNPANASIAQQEAVAERVLHAQGWGAWPNSSVACGL